MGQGACLARLRDAFHKQEPGLEWYASESLPEHLKWLAGGVPPGFTILVFGLADEDTSEDSVLPIIEGRRLGYIVCQTVEYETARGAR